MRTSRKLFLTSALAAATTVLAAVPVTPAEAVNGPGAGIADMVFTFDTPIPAGACLDTGFTVSGTLQGTFVFNDQLVVGDFDVAGAGASAVPGFCQSATAGDFFFPFDLTGVDENGHVVDCELQGWIVRLGWSNPGAAAGFCTIDGAPTGRIDLGFEGQQVTDPPEGAAGLAPTTAVRFISPYVQAFDV